MSSPNQTQQPDQAADWVPGQTQPYTRPKRSVKFTVGKCFNTAYLRTAYFILKVILIVLQIGGAVSVSFTYWGWPSSGYYNFVAISGIAIIFITIILHFTVITTKFDNVPWSFGEMIFDTVWAILMLIAASIVTDIARKNLYMDSYAAAAFFGFASVLVYLIDAVIRLIGICRGERKKSKSPASTAAP